MSIRSTRPNGRRHHGRRGQALVEFALVFPIFMLVLSGIMDFGPVVLKVSVEEANQPDAVEFIILNLALSIVE